MRSVLLLAAVAAFGLTACEEGASRRERMAGGKADGICKPFGRAPAASAAPGAAAAGPEASFAVDDCLHRWGYTLARSDDDADVVAQAVVAACSTPLARWNQQSLGLAATGAGGRVQEAPSLLTGEPTNPIAEHNAFAERQAVFYVVQARAGKCDPPRDDDRAEGEAATERR